MTDQALAFWNAAKANPSAIGKTLPVHEDAPQNGYYRMKKRAPEIGWVPIAIGVTPKLIGADGEIFAKVGTWSGGDIIPAMKVWTWCCRYPVEHAVWQDVAVHGKDWPDSIGSIITGTPERAADGGDGRGVGIGDNQPDDVEDPLTTLQDAIEDLVGRALAEAGKAGTPSAATWGPEWKVKADRLANYTAAISDLGKRVDTAFETEKRPHLEAGRAVDNRWRPVKTRRDEATKRIKALLTPFLQAQRDFEMEQRRREAEAARVASPPNLDGDDHQSGPSPVETVKAKAGTMGRAVSLRKVYRAKVVDPVAWATHLLTVGGQPHPDLMEPLQTLANRVAEHAFKGMAVYPGIEAREEEVAR